MIASRGGPRARAFTHAAAAPVPSSLFARGTNVNDVGEHTVAPRKSKPVMHVALLRGINVGKAKRVSMADLCALCKELGYGDVKTLLNSGNVVFSAPRADAKAAARIQKEIASQIGVSCRVVVITAAELEEII